MRTALTAAIVAMLLLMFALGFVIIMLISGTTSARADGCVTMANGSRYCSIGHCQTNTWRAGWCTSKGCRRRQ